MKIKLWDMTGLGIIVSCNSGVVYVNQTGGTACFNSEMEGVFCPLLDESETLVEKLTHLTINKKHISDEDANEIDAILLGNPDTRFIKVDRSKLKQSWESWLHVVVDGNQSVCFENLSFNEAILTWPNSD